MANAREIKESLTKQLQAKGADVPLYQSKIEEYMWLYQQFRQMQTDIKKRGRTYKTMSAAGKEYEKENPSVKDALLYSRQMVAILGALGLDTKTVVGGTAADDEDDL